MKRKTTFEAIQRLLADGAWHALDDLREVTAFPAEWVKELKAEGLIDTRDQMGNTLVRLRPAPNGA